MFFVIGFLIIFMKNLRNDTRYFVPTLYVPNKAGQFAIFPHENEESIVYWNICREQFSKNFDEERNMFFLSVDYHQPYSTCLFFDIAEDILGIKSKTVFHKTEKHNILLVEPAEFWRKCFLRRSLMTLMCRLGMYFTNKGDWEYYLFGEVPDSGNNKVDENYKFARDTRYAIARFFCGFSKFNGKEPLKTAFYPEKHGWVEEFYNKDTSYIKKRLVYNDELDCCYKQRFVYGKELLLF